MPNAPFYSTPVSQPTAPAVAEVAPAPVPAPEAQEKREAIAAAAAMSPEAPAAFAAMTSNFAPTAKPAKARKASAPARSAAARSLRASRRRLFSSAPTAPKLEFPSLGRSLSKKYPASANYSPMVARFDGPKGTVWRLSVRGFDNQRKRFRAVPALRGKGGNCFVRSTAGDSPVQFASR